MAAPVFARHVVVDGSNIATEGRSMPSLAQLDEAVREYRREFPDDTIVVVVDATFGHRIDEAERATFDEAVAHNEIVSPPAGAIGRGDAFLLRIAEKVGATVLSNDSFQEFHGEYEWLFTNGRLIGGKPVPGVGWIFTPRTPVRGPRSRDAVRSAKRDRGGRKPLPEEQQEKVQKAIAVATEEVVEPDSPSAKRRRRRRGSPPPAEPVNEPLAFIELVANYPLGSEIEGEVDTFSSHGAFVNAGGARCYIPLSALGDPPPRAAKDVLRKGEMRTFVVQALDPPRRGVELALPEFARVSGSPSPETVEEEIRTSEAASSKEGSRSRGRGRGGGRRREAPAQDPASTIEPAVAELAGVGAAPPQPPTEPAPDVAAAVADPLAADEGAPARAARKRAAAKAAAPPAKARPARKAAAVADLPEPADLPAPALVAAEVSPAAPAPAKTTRKKAGSRPLAPVMAEALPPAPAPAKASRKKAATRPSVPPKDELPAPVPAEPVMSAPGRKRAPAKVAKATKVPAAETAPPAKGAAAKKSPAAKKAAKKAAAKKAPAANKAPAAQRATKARGPLE
ncbi:MAG TPA: S1 RNA-binding domain-containing protein [Acidimicrobiales bacterium]|nr:S1 RNA-binding domain-containing protein [Acidimicrobiales bacterium]